jgi:hypothetical protein
MRISFLAVVLGAVAVMVACSSNQPAQPAPEQKRQTAAPKPAETQTGRETFQRLYIAARSWAGDIKPFRVQSETTSEVNGQGGKAATWRASFASPSRRAIKTYLWTGAGDAGSRGVTPGTEDTYNPSNSATQVFDLAFLKVDTDKAFDVAQKHGGDKLTKKDPAQPVTYALDWSGSQNKLIWHVIYGSPSDAKLRVAVDATTGEFMRVDK